MFFEKLLKELKEQNLDIERLHLLSDDLMLAAISWQYVDKEINNKLETNDIWDCVKFDLLQWSELSGFINDKQLRKIFPRLKALKFIYPDGSMPDDVRALVRNKIRGKLKAKKKEKESE